MTSPLTVCKFRMLVPNIYSIFPGAFEEGRKALQSGQEDSHPSENIAFPCEEGVQECVLRPWPSMGTGDRLSQTVKIQLTRDLTPCLSHAD